MVIVFCANLVLTSRFDFFMLISIQATTFFHTFSTELNFTNMYVENNAIKGKANLGIDWGEDLIYLDYDRFEV